jgi:ribonuclease HII
LIVAGVDEAGRGSIIGPLVVAGVAIEEERIPLLIEIGVKDSKMLSPGKRRTLRTQIVKMSKISIVKLPPREIDHYVTTGKRLRKLNFLEAQTFGRILNHLGADRAVVDAADINPKRFAETILQTLDRRIPIRSEHKADRSDPVVSAASIIAKTERDKEIIRLSHSQGFAGSGYPSDPRTVSFLKDWLRTNGRYPAFSRRSWKTWERIKQEILF